MIGQPVDLDRPLCAGFKVVRPFDVLFEMRGEARQADVTQIAAADDEAGVWKQHPDLTPELDIVRQLVDRLVHVPGQSPKMRDVPLGFAAKSLCIPVAQRPCGGFEVGQLEEVPHILALAEAADTRVAGGDLLDERCAGSRQPNDNQ